MSTLLNGFDAWLEQELVTGKVPGAAVAVVRKSEVILCKGYGLRDVEKGLPVTPETLFAIGSCSKAFTSFDVALLVEEGKLDWDTPVRHYLPDFRLHDPVATEQTTPRDLCSHRTGLPRHDFAWYGSPHTRAQLFERLRYLQPNKPFRYAYEYQNLMFMTAGYLVGQVTGSSWEQFTQERVFSRLGMTSSNLSVEVSKQASNAALPYELRSDQVAAVPFRNLDNVGPAGSINSTLVDLLPWLKLHLYGDDSILPRAALKRMHEPHTVIPDTPDMPWGDSDEVERLAYALGWAVQTYRGHTVVRHMGGIDGFIASVSFMPHDDIGVIVLSNLGENNTVTAINFNLYDRLLGLDLLPWSERMTGLFARLRGQGEKAKQDVLAARKEGTSPSHALADYAGAYEHPGYGRLTISLNGEVLEAAFNGFAFTLAHHHYDVFQLTGKDNSIELFLLVSFASDLSGSIQSISVGLEPGVEPIVFERAAQ